MDEVRAAELRVELRLADEKFAALMVGDVATWKERQAALERCHELEAAIAEAEGMSLTGEGTPRP